MTKHERIVAALHAHGVAYPETTIEKAHAAGMRVAVACTNLQLETSGGHNVFGHDPTSSVPSSWKGGKVTRWRYLYYRARRVRHGLQGVGPCQLTSRDLQIKADRLGGCWRPGPNMAVGFEFLQSLIRQYGSVRLGFQHYNGSGPAAVHYGYVAELLVDHWQHIIDAA
ncbi:MAG: hypothetical protein ACXVHX_22745 [Solirubrobacteraceae bacterium]